MNLEELPIDIYLDGAQMDCVEKNADDPLVKGFTTNPSLARRAGVTDYFAFCKVVAKLVYPKCVSLEVIADDQENILRQARKLHGCGDNVFVKIPVMTTKGEYLWPIIQKLSQEGIKLNVTACFLAEDIFNAARFLAGEGNIVSVFCGRIADTLMEPPCLKNEKTKTKFLWASAREPYSIKQAVDLNYDIITLPEDIFVKAKKFAGMDLGELTRKTVEQFYGDALTCTFEL